MENLCSLTCYRILPPKSLPLFLENNTCKFPNQQKYIILCWQNDWTPWALPSLPFDLSWCFNLESWNNQSNNIHFICISLLLYGWYIGLSLKLVSKNHGLWQLYQLLQNTPVCNHHQPLSVMTLLSPFNH